MRHKRNRNLFNFEGDSEVKKMIYISAAVLLLTIIFFVMVFNIYGNTLKNDKELSKINSKSITDLGKTVSNIQTEEVSTSIGKSVNELKNDAQNVIENKEETTKIAVNTSNMENTIATDKKQEKNDNSVKKEKKLEFVKPVQGEIIKDFAKDTLIYSETLKEWVTHMGIDIKADKTTVVKSAEEGIIKSIKNDPRYGITVVIEHDNGYTTIYSNLLTAEFVKEGEKVSKNQTIGTVGNTATFEILDEPHLHFEILKDGEYVDPNLYLK